MKRSPAILLACSSLFFSAAADEAKSTVRFSNNDRLSGSMESLTPETLFWKSPILEKPAPFLLKSVLDLTRSAEQPEVRARHEASVTLTNGDQLRGQLVSASDDIVELDTWFAGLMKFNRLMIADIRISERPDFIYRGPTGLDGWKQSGEKPAWSYQNSAFRSSGAGSIARDVKLPDECTIAFDAAWRNSFGLELGFFSDDLTNERPNTGYVIRFQQRSVSLRSCNRAAPRSLGSTVNALSLQENEKAHIEIRASLKSGKFCLFVDGHIIDVWTDPDVAKNPVGRGIHFITSNASPVQISQIEVGVWDGELEQLPDPQGPNGIPGVGMPGEQEMDDEEQSAPQEKPKVGRMELRNGDNIAGEVVSIVDGMITVKTPFRDVRLPIESLRSLSLKQADLERCKRENGDVRGWFPDGSSVVFRLDAVNGDSLSGYSQNFGTAGFKISSFSRIEFNIYDPELEDIRAAGGW